jgi:hypothetical protein
MHCAGEVVLCDGDASEKSGCVKIGCDKTQNFRATFDDPAISGTFAID